MKRSLFLKFAVFMSVNLLVVISLYVLSYQLWTRSLISIGIESLVAVLSGLCAAAIALQYSNSGKRSYILLAMSFVYYSIIEMGGAIEKHFTSIAPIQQKKSYVLSSDILEIGIFGLLFLIGIFLEFKGNERPATKTFNLGLALLVILLLLFHGTVRLNVLPNMNPETVMVIASICAVCTIIILACACILVIRGHRLFEHVSSLRIVASLVLLSFAVLSSWLAIFTNSSIWIWNYCLSIVAIFTFYIAFSVSYFKTFNTKKSRNGTVFPYSVAFLIIILLFITMIVELGWPHFIYIDLGVATLARIGAIAMSITVTAFTFKYAKMTKKEFLYPILFIYSLWIVMGVIQVLFSMILSIPQVESLAYYIVATLLSIPAFIISAIRIDQKKSDSNKKSPIWWIMGGFVIGGSLVTFGEGIRFTIFTTTSWDPTPIGRSLLLGLCLIAITELTYISFMRFKINKGTMELDSLSIAFLSLWFIPSLLKGNFATWTAGWWISEAVLLVGLFIAPLIMGFMYLDSSFRAQQSETRAKVYGDLLAHDISNHHQIIMSTIELVLMDSTPDMVKKKALEDAYKTLEDADSLVRNVRKLGSLEVISKELEVCNLLTAITNTYELVTRIYPNQTIRLELSNPHSTCEILANNLLPDIFQNLLLNAIEYSEGNIVDIIINQVEKNGDNSWEVRISDQGPGIPPEKRGALFTRYMKGAKGSGLGLSLVQALTEFFNGTIHIEDRILGDYRQGSCFVLRFPVYCD